MTDKVFIEQIKLTQFRNYQSLSQKLSDRHVVLTGENGSGKTNFLEAISLLSPGRGMRRAAFKDLPNAKKSDEAAFSIFAKTYGMQGEADIGTGLSLEDASSRRIRINGVNVKTNDELLDHMRILWLLPSMDGLFTGGAGDRRRFLDRLVLAIDPAHGKRSVNYERAMRSRNKLLSDNYSDPIWLTGLEEQMAELGIAISVARYEFVKMMLGLIANNAKDIPFPMAELFLEGFDLYSEDMPASDLEEVYIEQLRTNRSIDAAAGRTLSGPHRMDFIVFHREKNMQAAQCSTGEQKALLIGLILAHARLVKNLTGFAPILLLDEVAAHLDQKRRAALFELIDQLDCQAFMTGTDRVMFDALDKRAQYFNVAAGELNAN